MACARACVDEWMIVYTTMRRVLAKVTNESIDHSSGRNRDAASRGGGGTFSAPGRGAARNLSPPDVTAWWCAFRATNFDAGLIVESVGL